MIYENPFKRRGWYEQYVKKLVPFLQKTQTITIMNLFPLLEVKEIVP